MNNLVETVKTYQFKYKGFEYTIERDGRNDNFLAPSIRDVDSKEHIILNGWEYHFTLKSAKKRAIELINQRLHKAGAAADSYTALKIEVSDKKCFVEVTERLYFEALGSMPPIYLNEDRTLWQLGEEYSNGLFYTFGRKDGKFWGCLCNKNFALNNF